MFGQATGPGLAVDLLTTVIVSAPEEVPGPLLRALPEGQFGVQPELVPDGVGRILRGIRGLAIQIVSAFGTRGIGRSAAFVVAGFRLGIGPARSLGLAALVVAGLSGIAGIAAILTAASA